jgi:hypothetical protein
MSQFVETNLKGFTAGGALGQYLRVTGATSLSLADASTVELGTLENATFASGDLGQVRLRTANGTAKMVAAGAITAGAPVYAAASGKIDASGTVFVGTALEAAGADNDVIEVLRGPNTDLLANSAVVKHLRTRVTTAQVNAGHTLLPALAGQKYRLVDLALIAIGGNAATATGVLVRGTQSAAVVKLMDAKVAGLTQSTLLRIGTATNGVILADGASFVANDANTAITIIKDGSDLATATNIDVLLSYTIEA